MLRDRLSAALLCTLLVAGGASAQTAPTDASVTVASLAAPDFFSAGGRETGLPADLWAGASPGLLRAALPVIAAKPLSPAARALARRLLATGASAPGGIGRDPSLAGLRVGALIAQGGVREASDILSKTSGLDRDPALAGAAVEAALLSGQTDKACAIGDALATGRDEAYWLKLRAYCQLSRGEVGAAQLTFDLAQEQAKDPVYGRLMGARLAGAGRPGKASLRNGLDYALSQDLKLDMTGAVPSPAVAAALNPDAAVEAHWILDKGLGAVRATLVTLAAGDLPAAQTLRASLTAADLAASSAETAMLDAALAAASGQGVPQALAALIDRARQADAKARPRLQAAALLLAALDPPEDASRAALAAFTAGDAKASPARMLMLDQAAATHRVGETAILALWISADAGAPASADRARIVQALRTVGLQTDARAFALEGLLK